MIRKPELRNKFSKGAIKTSNKYSINIISEKMLNLYSEIIDNYKNINTEWKSKLKNFFTDELGKGK